MNNELWNKLRQIEEKMTDISMEVPLDGIVSLYFSELWDMMDDFEKELEKVTK